jgi:hypothetical protein
MGRIVKVSRKVNWRNPLKDFEPLPYLSGPKFPVERGGPADKKALATLMRFFTTERTAGEIDARAFQQFLKNPGKPVFVIWGDIGIGKTCFVRYQLHRAYTEEPDKIRYEIVDMLHASKSTAQAILEQHITIAIEHYLSDTFGSVERGLRPYAELRAKRRYGQDGTAQEINLEAKRIANEIQSYAGQQKMDALLSAIENVEGPNLFIAVDNLDRATDDEQNWLTDLIARMLQNVRIYIIFPLRSSSGILLDEGKVLGMFPKQEMHLSAVNFRAMLIPRFNMSEPGTDIRELRIPLGLKDSSETSTFPQLLESFLASDASTFVMDLAGTNSRQFLDFVHRVMYSNQLDSVRNIARPEYCVAALLMHDAGSFTPELSYLVNLFDDDNPDQPGNALIRFRVLEFFKNSKSIRPSERLFTDYFDRLGYISQRLKLVIALFVGARLLKTAPVMTAEQIVATDLAKIPSIERVEANVNQYFDKLLRSPWYFICAKRGIHISEHLITQLEDGTENVPDSNFVRFLKEEEDEERRRITYFIGKHGTKLGTLGIALRQPWQMARDAFGLRDRPGGGRESEAVKQD